MRRDSSVVEHFHGKEGVLSSNLSRGSNWTLSLDVKFRLFLNNDAFWSFDSFGNGITRWCY